MTDIVERSKQCPAVCDCDGEACLLYELRAEIERLRAALQEIADFPYVGTQASQKIWGIARRALEPKP